ncbi:N-6 DNA Methylase [Streptomyces sp. di188]|nr:N-6 DNA Methylase [Streptomyces sp. di50b]SCE54892.1 N-6 DNA Methylase [Streptomyces sp. di188]
MHWGWTPGSGKKADLMFVQHMVSVLEEDGGRAAVVMPYGVLFRGGKEREIRVGMLRADCVEAVIGLGPNLFYGAGVPACILILRPPHGKTDPKRREKVLFINADRDFTPGRNQNELGPEHIEKIVTAARFRDVGQPCSYPDLMMRLRPDEGRCLTAYLELVLGSSRVRRDVQAGARGTSEGMVKISAGTVESLRIPLPTIAEQQKAVDAVTSVDRRSATVRVLLDKLRVTQRAVVEDLLSGRTRVNRT